MNKTKIISVMIVTLLLGMGLSSMSGAEEMDGSINTVVEEYIGVVYPHIEIDNETSITLKVNITDDGDNTSYHVEDTLQIPLEIADNTDRGTFIFPRAIFYSVLIRRPIFQIGASPEKILKSLFPVFQPFDTARVTNSTFGPKEEYLNISIDYYITNDTFYSGENLTMNLLVMGVLPGEVNGIGEMLPIVDHKQVTLVVSYEEAL